MNKMHKGKLIVIDGTDGSGKATQTNLLVKRLKKEGYSVQVADFPQYGKKSAALVEEYLNGKFGSAKDVGPYRASVFYAVDRYAVSIKIKEWLKKGKIVISNRYVSANMGHQAGKIKDIKKRDRFLEWLTDFEYNLFGIPKPNLNVLLYMPPKIGQKLVEKKGHRDYVGGIKKDLHEADLEHLKDAAEAFRYVAKKYKWTVINCAPDNNLMTIEEIHKILFKQIKQII